MLVQPKSFSILIGAMIAVSGTTVMAQHGGGGGGGGGGGSHGGGGGSGGGSNNNQQGMPVFTPSTPTFGVPSAAPRPISGLGGVPAQGGVPAATPGFRPSTSSGFTPMRVGPFPGVINTPGTPTQLPSNTPSHPGGGDRGRSGPGRGGSGNGIPGAVGADVGGAHGESDVIIIPRTASGLNFNAAFHGDRLKLGLHLGLNDNCFVVPGHHHHDHFPFFSGFYPWWYAAGAYDLYNGWYNYGYPTVQGTYADISTAQQPQAPAPAAPSEAAHPVTEREVGDLYLRSGESRSAATSYRAYLKKNPQDGMVMRSLGMALFESGQTKEAVATIAMAYRVEPSLAENPFPADVLAGGAEEVRTNIRKASVYANKTKGAAEWLTVAVLMQAEGRDDLARTMLDRASAAGLDPALALRLRQALTH